MTPDYVERQTIGYTRPELGYAGRGAQHLDTTCTRRKAERMANAIAAIIVILLVVAAFTAWRHFMQRAVRSVVTIFRDSGATSSEGSKTLVELGLAPKPFLERAFRRRDYKQSALRLLDQERCVKLAEAGRVWLCEETLRNSRLAHFAKLD